LKARFGGLFLLEVYMSQGSLVLPTTGTLPGLTLVQDVNAALDALNTKNSGAAAPAVTEAYMWWADTTTGLLKIRNAANSAWVTVGTLAAANLGLLSLGGGALTGLLKFAAGANIASAATVDLTGATGNAVHITGTTGIGAWTMTSGQLMDVIFDGVLVLTHHTTNNNLQGGANITTAAGDRARLWYDGTTVYCLNYSKASGAAVVAPAALSTASGSAPSYAARSFVNFNGTGTVAIRASGNVSSITDNGVGDYTINYTTAMPDANYTYLATTSQPNFNYPRVIGNLDSDAPTTTALRIKTAWSDAGTAHPEDEIYINVAIFR
jgi:hypothetical protein